MSESTSSGGVSFTSLLLLLFIGLKLGNVINWSWWWVMSPLWISIVILLFILFIMLVTSFISDLNKNRKFKQYRK